MSGVLYSRKMHKLFYDELLNAGKLGYHFSMLCFSNMEAKLSRLLISTTLWNFS